MHTVWYDTKYGWLPLSVTLASNPGGRRPKVLLSRHWETYHTPSGHVNIEVPWKTLEEEVIHPRLSEILTLDTVGQEIVDLAERHRPRSVDIPYTPQPNGEQVYTIVIYEQLADGTLIDDYARQFSHHSVRYAVEDVDCWVETRRPDGPCVGLIGVTGSFAVVWGLRGIRDTVRATVGAYSPQPTDSADHVWWVSEGSWSLHPTLLWDYLRYTAFLRPWVGDPTIATVVEPCLI